MITFNSPIQRRISVFTIAVLGITLRVYHINYQSLWLDELYSVIHTDPSYSFSTLISYCKLDQPPAFFICLQTVFKFFGYHEVYGRITCAIIGILSIPVSYLLGKECGNRNLGLWTALLTSVNYFHIYYSQELRFYSLTFLMTTLSYLFFIRSYKNGTFLNYTVYTVFTVILLYTHYFGLLIYGIQALTFILLAVFYRKNLRFIATGVICGVIVAVAFTPWISVIIKDLGITEYWLSKSDPLFLLKYIYDYFGKDTIVTSAFVVSLYLFFKYAAKRDLLQEPHRPVVLILGLWLGLSYIIPYLYSVTVTPILHVRYTIVSLPVCLIIFAFGVEKIADRKWGYLLPPTLVLSSLINIFFVKHYYDRPHKTQFREASLLVRSKNQQQHPVFSSLPWHFSYYFRDVSQRVDDIAEMDKKHPEKFWLLQAHFPSFAKQQEVEGLAPDFVIAERYPLYDAEALLMVRKNP